ncbi:NDR1/HIN1-like protein 12 [Arachis ipaensis]|uniref:NDR1/HIN1-like protein 12 n=1 Tax=Arachis ipaensis TaxID=130454 RepID=UPI0007AF62EF|nr:NDR1/HIN1-like protein 12 [Arachis ipaensis]
MQPAPESGSYNHSHSHNHNQNRHHRDFESRDGATRYHNRRLRVGRQDHTNPLIWLLAIICTIIALAVIVAGIVVFAGYILIRPRVPTISVTNAHLDIFRNDYTGILETQLRIQVMAQNENMKAHASFSDIRFNISFQGQPVAMMVADPFDVPKNNTQFLNYFVQSSAIPLTPEQMQAVTDSWKLNLATFDFKGNARTQWRIGPLIGSVKFWCYLDCKLKFHPLNGSYIHNACTSKSK